eukprot:gene39934-49356_t
MTSDLRNRLLLLLVLPLCLLAVVGVWMDYRSADDAASRHDQRLLRLLPALADSVVAPSIHDHQPPLLLLAPPVEDFLRQNAGFSGYSVRDIEGQLLLGDAWVDGAVPATAQPEFHSLEYGGVTYRVAVLRGRTGAGELVVSIADGSDPRQQWAQQLLLRVLLPNLVLVAAAALAIHWAVGRDLCGKQWQNHGAAWIYETDHARAHHAQEHRENLSHVGRKQVTQELADVLENRAAFAHGLHDGGEVVVGQHHASRLFGHVGASQTHGDADITVDSREGEGSVFTVSLALRAVRDEVVLAPAAAVRAVLAALGVSRVMQRSSAGCAPGARF